MSLNEKKENAQPDLSGQVPDLAPYLLPGEKVVSVENVNIKIPQKMLEWEKALCLLTRVTDLKDVGKNGPPFASAASVEDAETKALRLYEAVFGRDSLYMSDHLLEQFPDLARATLLHLAAYQGMEFHMHREEEPGRIPHEIRNPEDPIAIALQKEKGIEWPYYASIDSTPLFVRVLHRYCTEVEGGMKILEQGYQDRKGETQTLLTALMRAVGWILRRMDQNKEGFIETRASFPGGLFFQGLQDSQDVHDPDGTYPLFHRDGSMANTEQGIVVTEVQAQAYDALIYAAEIFERTGPASLADALGLSPENLRARALRLKAEIMKFQVDDEAGAYFAAGADRSEKGDLRLFKIKKAIPAFLLNTTFLDVNPEEGEDNHEFIEKWLSTLFSPEMLAAGGLRSMASDEMYYAPHAYHNGAVWPMITFEIARGLRRQGYRFLAEELENRVCRCCDESCVYPEYVQGNAGDITISARIVRAYSEKFGEKKREQPPQLYQGWTVSSYAHIHHDREVEKHIDLREKTAPRPIELEILKKLGIVEGHHDHF